MLAYLLKRLLLFIPTLFIIAVASFFLSKQAPGDPVEEFLNPNFSTENYAQQAHQMGYDRPLFYFQLTTAAYPDTFYRIFPPYRKNALRQIAGKYGNWDAVQQYSVALTAMKRATNFTFDSLTPAAFSEFSQQIRQVEGVGETTEISSVLLKSKKIVTADSTLNALFLQPFSKLETAFSDLEKTARTENLLRPKSVWHGWDNQFHRWFSNFLKGDFGISFQDRRPVASRIGDALFWTLLMNLSAILLAFAIAIPLGVWSARRQGSWQERSLSVFLFMLFSLPVFWVATMLIVFFTTPEYGMDWFSSIGLGNPLGTNKAAIFWERTAHLFLPVLCLTYPSIAVITRQMRSAMIQELGKDYIRTAHAKGLSERRVVWIHAFRNSLFPIITLFSSVFPAAIAGSVVIEVIFNIPGMGRLMVEGILQRDWPVVYTILMFGAVLTMAGMLVADILYAIADPRVRFEKK